MLVLLEFGKGGLRYDRIFLGGHHGEGDGV